MRNKILAFLVMASLFSFGQDIQNANNQNEKPFIEVIGTATRLVTPDKIFISITLTNKIIGKEEYTIEKQEEKLKSAIKDLNIDLKNLYLSDSNSEITRYKKRETGIKLSKEYTLIVKNAEEVSLVFRELNKIEIKEAAIEKAESSEITTIRKEVRIEAIQAAKEKASYLLTAIGEQLGKPLIVREERIEPYTRNLGSNTFSNSYYKESKSEEISFEKIEVTFSYYVKYAIK